MLNLVDKQVTHEIFGQGNVVKCDEGYIKIQFSTGEKRFVFPDAFVRFLTLADQATANIIKRKIQERDKTHMEEELQLQKKRAFKREQYRLNNNKKTKGDRDALLRSQSVFWVNPGEIDQVFKDWNVFIGAINSGQKKGQPRRLTRVNQNSACLLSARNTNELEEDRRVLGVFMVDKGFNGRMSLDGYIPAHPEYRIHLSKEESEKMLFWNYYMNNNNPNSIVWKSGRHRYFENIWMAQILRDIVHLRDGTKEQNSAENFLEYFCQVNGIDINQIPTPNGGLIGK